MSMYRKLPLTTYEVKHLLERKLKNDALFYESVIQKIAVLVWKAKAQHAYAFMTLYEIYSNTQALISTFFDEMDRLEGLLEAKKNMKSDEFLLTTEYHVNVNIENPIAATLSDLLLAYDRLISLLKAHLVWGLCGTHQDYLIELKSYFKKMNKHLSDIHLAKIQAIPAITLSDVLNESETYKASLLKYGKIDKEMLSLIFSSNINIYLNKEIRQVLKIAVD